MHDYIADPMSRKDLCEFALHIRKLVGCENQFYFPVIEFLENVMPQMFSGFNYEIVPKEIMGNKHGETIPSQNIIKIREDVYNGAVDDNGRDRLTVGHEIFHYLAHDDSTVRLYRVEPNIVVPAYRNPEWQANAFSGELLIPTHLTNRMAVHDIMQVCKVSYEAACTQLKAHRRCI